MKRPRRFGKVARLAPCLPLALFAAACDPPRPDGQVLASVDGVSITQAELGREFDLGGPVGDPANRARANAAVEQLVDRKLLAQAARARGIERDADYHFAMRRTEELLLLEALRERLAEEQRDISADRIARHIATNPQIFEGRRLLTLRAEDGRRTLVFDTARLDRPPDWLETVAEGRRLTLDGRRWTILAVDRIASSPETNRALARTLLVEEIVEERLAALLRETRGDSRIVYKNGWGPSAR